MRARTKRLDRQRAVRYLLLGVAISMAGLLTYLLVPFFRIDGLLSPTRYTREVAGPAEVLYVKGLAWGITGDHQVWWITTHRGNEEPDSLTDYVFPGVDPFFYEVSRDTLIVYTRRAVHTPPAFESGMAVRQVELSNPRMMGLYDRMDSLGLRLAR